MATTSRSKEAFEDYEGFVEKFKPKKTTDDCYTPDRVYNTVLNWAISKFGISNDTPIVRPFFPGGDYERYDYPENCVVIDNPPFSILSKIIKFYSDRRIKFFLFAPALTVFSSTASSYASVICTGVNITYENGAIVSTSFITNLTDGIDDGRKIQFMSSPDLYQELETINQENKVNKPKYIYNSNVATASSINQLSKYGVECRVYSDECIQVSKLDEQKAHKKAIYGKGYLLSTEAAKRIEEAKRIEAANRIEKRIEAAKNDGKEWNLSDREKELVEELDGRVKEQTTIKGG